jgi:hypothetical protein
LEDVGVNGKSINVIQKKEDERMCTEFICLWMGTVAVFCERGNELSDYIQYFEFLGQLINYKFLKDSATRN